MSGIVRLAVFDFDGTITQGDSLMAFMKFAHSPFSFFIRTAACVYMLAAMSFGLISRHKAKEHVMSMFFGGWDRDRFVTEAGRFHQFKLGNMLRKAAMDAIRTHQKYGHEVVILSASPDLMLLPFCQEYGLKLLSTQLEVKDGKLTGRFASPNCRGIEKVRRLEEAYSSIESEVIAAYGDKPSDRPFMELAKTIYYKPFR